jgi:D-cysteine desulfhydrase
MDSGASKPAKLSLGSWPTPLEAAPRLATALDLRPNDLWIKRDDLTVLSAAHRGDRALQERRRTRE